MRILFLTSGPDTPSSRFRVQQWLPHLRARGHDCVVAPSRPPKYEQYRWLGWRMSQRLQRASRRFDLLRAAAGHFDVVFLERELFDDDSAEFERRFRKVAHRFVLDVDDAIFLRHPGKFGELAALADVVIAGNARIADRAASLATSIQVIPTCVDLDTCPPRRPRTEGPLTLGWIGTSSNLPALGPIVEVLRRLQDSRRCRVLLVVNESPELERMREAGLTFEWLTWSRGNEARAFQQIDIGLMPLPDEDWNRYKCGFKLIQYMGHALPAVASPVGVNAEIVEPGVTGFLASTGEEWFDALDRLLGDDVLRRELGAAGRERVRLHYSIESQLVIWMRAVLGT